MTSIAKNMNGLSVESMTKPKLTPAQQGLLKTITDCVESNRPMDWDVVVLMYYNYVRKTYHDRYRYMANRDNGLNWKYDFDILEEYQNMSATWTYHIRVTVRQWFLINLGNLIIKNQLIVTPVIAIE